MTEFTGAQYSTVRQSAQDLMEQLLSQLIPEIAAQPIAGLGTGMLSSLIGDQDDWNAVWSTNMTPVGVTWAQQRTQATRIGKLVGQQYQRTLLADRFRDMERTMTSREVFRNRPENNTLEGKALDDAYNAYIEGEVSSWMRKPGISYVYGMANSLFGFDSDYNAMPSMASAMSTIASQAYRDNDTRQLVVGRSMLENLFTGAWNAGEGVFDNTRAYDRYQWGGFSQGASAGIAARMIRDINPVRTLMHGMASMERAEDAWLDEAAGTVQDIYDKGAVRERLPELRQIAAKLGSTAVSDIIQSLEAGQGRGGEEDYAQLKQALDELIAANKASSDGLQDVIKRTTESFRDSVRKMTQALAPLKDVFGDDTGAMIQSIERLSGRSIGRLGADNVSRMATMIANNVGSGIYTLDELGIAHGTMQRRLMAMPGLAMLDYGQGAVMASEALIGANGGSKPAWLSDSQWSAWNANNVMSTHISEGADLQAKAYSLWRSRMEGGQQLQQARKRRDAALAQVNEDGSLSAPEKEERIDKINSQYKEEFDKVAGFGTYRQQVLDYADKNNVSSQRAAMELAQVRTQAELEAGYYGEGYLEAKNSGDAGRMATSEYTRQMVERTAASVRLNIGYRQGTRSANADDAEQLYRKSIELIRQNADVVDMDNARRTEYLRNLKGVDGTRQFNDDYIDRLNRSFTAMRGADRTLSETVNYVRSDSNREKAREEASEYARRKDVMDRAGVQLFQKDGILDQVLKTHGSISDIRRRLEGGSMTGLTALDKDNFTAILSMASDRGEQFERAAIASGENANQAKESGKTQAERIARYAMSDEGLTSRGFQDAVRAYIKNMKAYEYLEGKGMKDKSAGYARAMRDQQNLMVAYMELGDEGADTYLKQDMYNSKGEKITDQKEATEARMARLNRAVLDASSSDPVKKRSVSESLRFYSMSDKLSQGSKDMNMLWSEYQKVADSYGNKDNKIEFGEGWSIFKEQYKEKHKTEGSKLATLDELDKAISQVHSSISQSRSDGMNGILIQLKDVLNKLINALDEKNTKDDGVKAT